MLPLGALPATKPLIPFYSAVSMQPTEVPRWSTLLTPCFKTQPLSVLVYFHLRKGTQSWFPRRLWGGWCLGHWGPCRLEGQVSQLWWLPLPVPLETDGGKGVAIVLHSESTPCFYGVPGFFHKLFYLWSSLLQFHQVQFHQGTAVPYLAPNLTFQQPVHLHNRRLRLGCAGLQHRQCVQFLLCPACKRPSAVLSFALLEIFFLSQLISHQSGCYYVGLFCLFEWGSFLHLQLPARLLVLFLIPLFFISSCLFAMVFFLSFRCLKSSASVQQELCEKCSICRHGLDELMRRDEFLILLFSHLKCDLCQTVFCLYFPLRI